MTDDRDDENPLYGDDAIIALQVRIQSGAAKSPGKDEIDKLKVYRKQNNKPEVDSDGNTALILAAKTLDTELISHFCNVKNYKLKEFIDEGDTRNDDSKSAGSNDKGSNDEKEFKDALYMHVNNEGENALTAAVKVACEAANAEGVKRVLEAFSGENGTNDANFRKMIRQTNHQKMNLLHLVYSVPFRCEAANDTNQAEAYCRSFKNLLDYLTNKAEGDKETPSWMIDPSLEDGTDQKLTPFLYLMRNCPKSKLKEAAKDLIEYCKTGVERRVFKINIEDLLRNSIGLDIVHIRASSTHSLCSVEDLFCQQQPQPQVEPNRSATASNVQQPNKQLKAIPAITGTNVILYNNQRKEDLYHNQIVLGGPVKLFSISTRSNKKAGKYDYWTALHFACHGMSKSIEFLIDNNFSLTDTTASGKTCIQLLNDEDKLLKYLEIHDFDFEKIDDEKKREEERKKKLTLITEYIRATDPVKCALDQCVDAESDGEHNHAEQIYQETADKVVKEKIESLSYLKNIQLDELELKVAKIMWLCFRDDNVELFRFLLHSSIWKEFSGILRNKMSQQDIDMRIMKFFFLNRAEKLEKPKDRPILGRHRLRLKKDSIAVNKIIKEEHEGRPYLVLKYLGNGRVFLYQLLKNKKYFLKMSLIEFAVRTGRPQMAKALLLTRQMDLIPRAVNTIRICTYMIEKEHLLNFYPIMDVNNDLKSVKAFASKVAMNAIGILFQGCHDSDAKMIFEYLRSDGKQDRNYFIPQFGLDAYKLKNGKLKLKTSYSVEQLVRESRNVDFYSTECFQQLSQDKWNKRPKTKSNSSKNSNNKDCMEKMGHNVSRFNKYMQAPKRKLILYAFMRIVFIGMLITNLTFPSINFNWVDIVLIIFWFSLIMEEIELAYIHYSTPFEGLRSYFSDAWNLYNLLTWIFLTTALSLKLNLLARTEIRLGYLDSNTQSLPDWIRNKDDWRNRRLFDFKVLISLSLLFACTKFLKILRFNQSIGITLVVLPIIFTKDLFPFAVVLFVFITAFGSFFFSTLTMGRLSFFNNTHVERRTDSVLYEIYVRPLMVAFGEFEFDSFGPNNCEGSDPNTRKGCYFYNGEFLYRNFSLIVFLLIVNLVMFNMLIAKFSNTVSRYETRSRKIWLFMRDEMLVYFSRQRYLPPPLNILNFIYDIFCYVFRPCSCCSNAVGQENTPEIIRLAKFYLYQARKFSNKRHEMQTQQVETIEDEIQQRLYGDEACSEFLKRTVPIRIAQNGERQQAMKVKGNGKNASKETDGQILICPFIITNGESENQDSSGGGDIRVEQSRTPRA